MPLQIRRGTDAQRQSMTQALASGELLYVTDTQRIYVGTGNTLGGIAVTGYTNEDAQDAVAPMFTGGSHSGIIFAYNDAANVINATLDLSTYSGVINASAFKGTLVADDSTLLVDAVDAKINLDGTVKGNIVPNVNEAYDLGNASYRFRDLYLSGSSIKLGAATITATGSAVNLPAGSTIGGSAIGTPGGDLNVNIVADDSTVIVNTTTEVVTAQGGFVGNVTGNINGIVTGTAGSSLVGNVTGNVAGNVTGDINGIVTGTAGSSLVGNVTGNVAGNVTGDTDGFHTGDVKGSVFADDSSLMVDGIIGQVVGNINNTQTTTQTIVGGTIVLSGVDSNGVRAGINILTDGDADDGYSLFDIRGRNPGSTGQAIVFERGRGTYAAPASLQNGDEILTFAWFGLDSVVAPAAAAAIRVTVNGAVSAGALPGKIEIATYNAGGSPVVGLGIDSNQIIDVANNTVAANSGSGTADVSGGVVSYLKIKVAGVERAIPLYGIVP